MQCGRALLINRTANRVTDLLNLERTILSAIISRELTTEHF